MGKFLGNFFAGGGADKLSRELVKVLDTLSFLDNNLNDPISVEYIKAFRKRQKSIVILARPGVLEKEVGKPFSCRYTCDDYVIIEYDDVVSEIVQADSIRSDEQVSALIDNNRGIIIVEN